MSSKGREIRCGVSGVQGDRFGRSSKGRQISCGVSGVQGERFGRSSKGGGVIFRTPEVNG